MKKYLLFLSCCLTLSLHCRGQKEASNWYFGERAGLNFDNGYAEATTEGMILAGEGCATISEPETGKLQFYTNGIQMWNRQHRVMPNGSNLLSDLSSTQAALIVPYPGYPGQYFLFAVNSVGPLNGNTQPGLSYSIINMKLDGDLGDIEPAAKNVKLLPLTSEKLTAVPHANGKDYWVITHGLGNNEFYVFLLSREGVSAHRTFPVGMVHRLGNGGLFPGDIAGYLKASPDGRRIASAVHAAEPVPFEIFDFDPATGIISNAVSLGSYPLQYGVSFSPDNSKLYLSSVLVTQFNLSLSTAAEIINSRTEITPMPSTGRLQSLQLGPDGRLYNNVAPGGFYVINDPNRAGLACQPEYVEFDFGGGSASVGLPNFIQSYFDSLEPDENNSSDCDTAIQLYPNPTTDKVRFSQVGDCFAGQRFDLRVVSATGQRVLADQPQLRFEDEYEISGLAQGLYLFILTFKGNRQIITKVVKVN